jgi:uncharacterized protein (TIGR01319 family)
MSFLSDLLDNEDLAAVQQQPAASPRTAAPVGAALVLDIGNVHTRAVLFDVVDGQYRFVSRGEAPTTSGPPWNDVFEGVRHALEEISSATGRQLLDQRASLIVPERGEFVGVNTFAVTASAGKAIRAVLVGLVPDVSLASGKRAAESTYLRLADTISLADQRSPEAQIDAILHAEPDMVIIVGGTDGGAEDSLREQIRMIALSSRLMDRQFRPLVLYAGNKSLAEEARIYLEEEIGMRVVTADNVRPRLDVERLDGAQQKLAALYHAQKTSGSGGFGEIGSWTREGIQPTAHGFSRMIHILGEFYHHDVLGVDLGSASSTVAASIKGLPYLNVFPTLGIGHSAQDVLTQIRPEAMTRWLTFNPRHADEIQNYVSNKSLFPHIVPGDAKELEIEYALAREIIRRAVLGARGTWREVRRKGLLPSFGTILISGSSITRTPHDGWSALVALDGLLPVGVTRLLSDPYNLAPSLGVLAQSNPTAVVQALDTGSFYELGTVVSIAGRARKGDVVLRGSFKPQGSKDSQSFEVRYGDITIIPLPRDRQSEVTIQPRRVELEPGQSGSRKFTVNGGELGLIIDARGRPWRFPRDAKERQEMLSAWQRSVTGEQD